MAHKTIAIPSRLLKSNLSKEEKEEIEKNYGHQPLSDEDVGQLQLDEIEKAERKKKDDEEEAKFGYKKRRAEKFKAISIGDQLDAIWKALDQSGMALPVEAKNIITAIKAIKDSEPKPGGL